MDGTEAVTKVLAKGATFCDGTFVEDKDVTAEVDDADDVDFVVLEDVDFAESQNAGPNSSSSSDFVIGLEALLCTVPLELVFALNNYKSLTKYLL